MPSRRTFLRRSVLSAGALASGRALGFGLGTASPTAPALVTREAARPATSWGSAVGDVTSGRALVWSRTDRPSRLLVEWSTRSDLSGAERVRGTAALPETGFTARADLTVLPSGQTVFYRASFEDLSDLRTRSGSVSGRFLTAPAAEGPRRDVLLAWGADTVGQGWGIDLARGGLRTYESIRRLAPDLFLHVGDTIYADDPLLPERTLEDGSLWRNLITPAKSKVAESLEDFRGCFEYNLLDENLRRFQSEVPLVALWDDHEVRNNWWPEQVLDDPRYTVRSVALLEARAKRAFLEYQPVRTPEGEPERIFRALPYGPLVEVLALDLRSERAANTRNREPGGAAILGARQLSWLKERLASSRAVWKVVACDMPIGLVVRDGPERFEAVANADPGPPSGRELEIASLLRFLKERRVRNVVWLTGDVHYAAAHHYHPDRAAFKEFDPFWEFVAGPLHAGTFGPSALDGTFGPEVRFCSVPADLKPNRPPSEGLQFFGTLRVDGKTAGLTVRLHDATGKVRYAVDLAASPDRVGQGS